MIRLTIYLFLGALTYHFLYGVFDWNDIWTYGVIVLWPGVLLYYSAIWIAVVAVVVFLGIGIWYFIDDVWKFFR